MFNSRFVALYAVYTLRIVSLAHMQMYVSAYRFYACKVLFVYSDVASQQYFEAGYLDSVLGDAEVISILTLKNKFEIKVGSTIEDTVLRKQRKIDGTES